MAKIREAFMHNLIQQYSKGEISFSRMVELLNEKAKQLASLKAQSVEREEINCTSSILACKHKGDVTCKMCCYNGANINNIPIDETGKPNANGYFVKQSAKEWIKVNGTRITNESGLTDADRIHTGYMLMPEIIEAMEQYHRDRIREELRDELILFCCDCNVKLPEDKDYIDLVDNYLKNN